MVTTGKLLQKKLDVFMVEYEAILRQISETERKQIPSSACIRPKSLYNNRSSIGTRQRNKQAERVVS